MPQKPSGSEGPVFLSPKEKIAEWQKIEFPTSKDELEIFIMNLFSRNVSRFAHVPERDGFEILSYDKLPEDDFDFLAETNKGTKYVELVEIRPEGKDGYEKYKEKITVGEFSDFVLSVLEKKEQKLYQSD